MNGTSNVPPIQAGQGKRDKNVPPIVDKYVGGLGGLTNMWIGGVF